MKFNGRGFAAFLMMGATGLASAQDDVTAAPNQASTEYASSAITESQAATDATQAPTKSTNDQGDAANVQPAAEPAANVGVIPVSVPSEPVPESVPEKRGNRLVEEVVVTSQRREERLIDVPIAITAFTAEQLDAAHIESAQDMQRVTPGFTVTQNGGYNIAFIRGVGTDAFLPGADSSVPFYLDGVALNSATQGTSDTLGRIARVEVLKGPQGTLFGRNATGGAVNIITPDPNANEWGGDIKIDRAQYSETDLRVYASGPLIDGVAIALSAFDNRRDNYQHNLTGPIIATYARGGRAKLKWNVTDDLDVVLTGSLQKVSDNAGLAVELTPGPLVGVAYPSDAPLDRQFSTDGLNGAVYKSSLISAQADWRLDVVNLRLIGSDQRANSKAITDFDQSPLPILVASPLRQPSTQKTAELQLLSTKDTPFGDRFEWVGGLFYLEGGGGFEPLQFRVAPNALGVFGVPNAAALNATLDAAFAAAGLPPFSQGISANNTGVIYGRSYSTFFQGTYELLPDVLHFTLGGRYQWEERDLTKSSLAVATADGGQVVVRNDKSPVDRAPTLHARQISPRVALRWNPGGGENQIYTSWARGFKSPTYNTVNVTETPQAVQAERVDSYELGFKSRFFDNTLQLNGAAFLTRQHNLLSGFVSILSGGIVHYQNAGDSKIKGVEADFVWVPMPSLDPGLAFTGSGAIIDARYTSYPNGPGFDETTGLPFGPGLTTPLPARDFSGNAIVRTPKYSYNLGINQHVNVSDNNDFEIGVDMAFASKFYFLPQDSNTYARLANTVVNAHASWFYNPWNIEATVFGRNITNETYVDSEFSVEYGPAVTLNPPRVFGAGLKWTF